MDNEKSKRKRTRRRILWGRVIIFLFILLLMAAAIGAAFYQTYLVGKSVYQEYDAMVEDFDRRQAQIAKIDSERFNDYTNILLLGIDDGEVGNTNSGRYSDTVVVASVNQKTGYMRLLSIPRDTVVRIPGRKTAEKMNQAYYYGGIQLSVRTVEELLKIPIQHYVVLDMEVFSEIIDKLGGINIYIENDMDYEDPYADLAIHFKKGYQYLAGAEAVSYLRYRSDELGDIGRVQRQQKFMKALYGEVFTLKTVAELPDLLRIVHRRVTTSLSAIDVAYLAKGLSNAEPEMIKAEMLPGKFSTVNDAHYWTVDVNAANLMLEEMFQTEEKK